MIVNEISLWGAALVAIIVVIAMIALAFVDSKMLRRMLVICCGVVGLQDICLVGLSALVPADPVSVDLLGSVSYTVYVEKGVEARKCCDAGRLYRGGRQYDAMSANECLSDSIFSADGLYDGIDDSDDGELPAQPTGYTHESRGAQAGTLMA